MLQASTDILHLFVSSAAENVSLRRHEVNLIRQKRIEPDKQAMKIARRNFFKSLTK